MFDKFKAKHGGVGPFQALNLAVTGGEGVLGRAGVKRARGLLNSIIDQQEGDKELAGSMAPVWENLRRTRMTEAELEKSASALVQRGADIKDAGKSLASFGELQKRYRGSATNKEDHAILDSLDTQAQIAHDKAVSSNPQIQAKGLELFGQVLQAQREYATKNEEQRIAADNTIGARNFNEFNTLQDNYTKESQSFLAQRAAYGKIKASLALPDSAAADLSLIINYMKVLDPNSAVLPGEAANAQNAAGVPDIVLTAYNHLLRDGQRLTPEQRKDYFKSAGELYSQGRGEQMERGSRYLGQARDLQLPENMLQHFTLPLDSPGESPSDFGRQQLAPPDNVPEADSRARMVGESVASGVGTVVGGAVDAVTGALTPAARALKSLDQTLGETMGIYHKPDPPSERYPRSGVIQRNTDEF